MRFSVMFSVAAGVMVSCLSVWSGMPYFIAALPLDLCTEHYLVIYPPKSILFDARSLIVMKITTSITLKVFYGIYQLKIDMLSA